MRDLLRRPQPLNATDYSQRDQQRGKVETKHQTLASRDLETRQIDHSEKVNDRNLAAESGVAFFDERSTLWIADIPDLDHCY
jgi:hypothetical protein